MAHMKVGVCWMVRKDRGQKKHWFLGQALRRYSGWHNADKDLYMILKSKADTTSQFHGPHDTSIRITLL
jgi:hypothetical protein